MVYRIYAKKKNEFGSEAATLHNELKNFLGIKNIENLQIVNRYDVEGISKDLFQKCIPLVFSEPQVDEVCEELEISSAAHVFAVEFLPGQFDQRADSASECILLISQ
ncbi:MAG: hypothetical protein HUJ63_09585, partial [Enterococcus sp.]|nr:hypothetical protein [Enterococcus sp.]